MDKKLDKKVEELINQVTLALDELSGLVEDAWEGGYDEGYNAGLEEAKDD